MTHLDDHFICLHHGLGSSIRFGTPFLDTEPQLVVWRFHQADEQQW